MNSRRRVSMKDVAALAGVSVGTVSNVLNAPERVSDAMTQRVSQAIEELGWVPNESARQLRRGRSQAVGLVVYDIANPFFADVTLGAESVLYKHGFSVQIGNSSQAHDRETRLLKNFEQQRVRGVLLAPIANVTDMAHELRKRGIPVVMLDRARDDNFCEVGVDDLEGGRLATAHLIERGHRRLAFVGGPSTLAQVRARRAGAELAMQALGDEGSLLAISTPALAFQPGMVAAREIVMLPDDERPTAVFAANDLLAIGLLQGFVAAGLRVPEDIALIGYDDIEFAAASAVPLSSVRQPRHRMGEQAATMLIDEIDALDEGRQHQHEVVRMTPVLVPRASSAAGPRPS